MAPSLRQLTEMLRESVAWAGRSVLEVGCGDGRLLGWLAREGAMPVGLDPGPGQLDRARANAPGLRLVAGLGQLLPFGSGRFDLVLFVNSLHHVPMASQWHALVEAARVLGRDGQILVIEPLPEGEFFALLQPVDDETEVRREVFRVLHAAGALGLRMASEIFYSTQVVEASWAALRERILAIDPARAAALAGAEAEVELRFATLGEAVEGGRAFIQPMRLNLLRRA